MNAIEQLKSVLCGPDGKCCITGAEEDHAIVDRALQALAAPLPAQRELIKELADQYARACVQFAKGIEKGADSNSPVASKAGDSRLQLHAAIDAATICPAQPAQPEQCAAFGVQSWSERLFGVDMQFKNELDAIEFKRHLARVADSVAAGQTPAQPAPVQPAVQKISRDAIVLALVGGPHQIDIDRVALERDPKQSNGSALAQIADRLAALLNATAPQPAQRQAEQAENRFVRELREYAQTNQGAYLFPMWDIDRALKYLTGYTAPPQRQPLTLEQINEWFDRRMKAAGPNGITCIRSFAEECVRVGEKGVGIGAKP